MKVPDDYSATLQAAADDVPRKVWEALLAKMLPRVPVKVRRPEGGWKSDPVPAQPMRDPFGGPAAEKVRMRRKLRNPRSGNRTYRVINPNGASNHRRSWRKAMVEAILMNDNERDALRTMEENYRALKPKWADMGIDLTWVATEAGYVELI